MKKYILGILSLIILITCVASYLVTNRDMRFEEWSDKEWAKIEKANQHRYHFQQLNEGEKENYIRLAQGLRRFEEEIYLEADQEESLYKAYNALINDNPDIFWIGAFDFEEITTDEILVRVEQPDNVKQIYQDIQTKADQIVAQIPAGSDYDKVKYLYEYVILNTAYDLDAENNQDVRSVLFNQSSVCTGYAKTFQLLAEKAGIETIFVAGYIEGVSDYGHAWNMVKIGSYYYWVDPTWGDPVFEQTFDLAESHIVPDISYRFLCVPDRYFAKTHRVETGIAVQLGYVDTLNDDEVWVYPPAIDNSLNHSLLNGGYFATYERSEIEAYIQKSLALPDHKTIDFQFFDDAVYQEAKQDLLDKNYLGELLSAYWPDPYAERIDYYIVEEPATSSFSLILE